jgi:hypothetical protein
MAQTNPELVAFTKRTRRFGTIKKRLWISAWLTALFLKLQSK